MLTRGLAYRDKYPVLVCCKLVIYVLGLQGAGSLGEVRQRQEDEE